MEAENETTVLEEYLQHEDFAENTPQFNETLPIEKRSSSSPKTAQQAYLSAILGDVIKIQEVTENALINAQKIRSGINQSFEEMEKSISEMNTQVEESIKKQGEKASVTIGEKVGEKLNLMLQQMTVQQLDSLNKIQAFFDNTAKKLAPELDEEINDAKQKALKEIAVLIDRINGDKLVTKLVTYAIIFSISSSLITSSLMYMIITHTTPVAQVQTIQTQQTTKHR